MHYFLCFKIRGGPVPVLSLNGRGNLVGSKRMLNQEKNTETQQDIPGTSNANGIYGSE